VIRHDMMIRRGRLNRDVPFFMHRILFDMDGIRANTAGDAILFPYETGFKEKGLSQTLI
jgi:hypothetical protein